MTESRHLRKRGGSGEREREREREREKSCNSNFERNKLSIIPKVKCQAERLALQSAIINFYVPHLLL